MHGCSSSPSAQTPSCICRSCRASGSAAGEPVAHEYTRDGLGSTAGKSPFCTHRMCMVSLQCVSAREYSSWPSEGTSFRSKNTEKASARCGYARECPNLRAGRMIFRTQSTCKVSGPCVCAHGYSGLLAG